MISQSYREVSPFTCDPQPVKLVSKAGDYAFSFKILTGFTFLFKDGEVRGWCCCPFYTIALRLKHSPRLNLDLPQFPSLPKGYPIHISHLLGECCNCQAIGCSWVGHSPPLLLKLCHCGEKNSTSARSKTVSEPDSASTWLRNLLGSRKGSATGSKCHSNIWLRTLANR